MSSPLTQSVNVQPGRKLLLWLPTVIWLGVIASFSTDLFSASHTGSILWRILHAIFPGISLHTFRTIHFFVRKTAHFCTYGLLGAFAFYSWRATFPEPRRWSFKWSGLALALTLVVASLDEYHQTFIPSRTGTVHDVILDMVGAVFFQIIILVFTISRG